MKQRINTDNAFTLIELMVVMLIIALMAGVAFPTFQAAMMTAKMNGAMQSARQIGLAIISYGGDHDGNYPATENSYGQAISSSNDAFRSLVPDYTDNESIFAVSGSAWGPSADGKIATLDQILQQGENHFSYISGLSSTAGSMQPLIVDGTDGHGYYTRNPQEKGGTWKGQKAVLIRNDCSSRLMPLKGDNNRRYIPDLNDPTKNLLETTITPGSGVVLLDPS